MDFRQLLSREAPAATVTVPATLSFPDGAKERYPAVVVVHTVAGYIEDNEGQYAAELRKWVEGGDYQRILGGDYPRRGQEHEASVGDDARDAAKS